MANLTDSVTSLGFLPEECCKQLPPAFLYLQPLLDNLPSTDGEKFRQIADSLPAAASLNETILKLTIPEKRFMYCVLSFIMQKYMWCCGTSKVLDVIPKEIGAPLLEISKDLGIIPCLTYASTVLWNWSYRDEAKPFAIENLKLNYVLDDSEAYEWFFLIHTTIEGTLGTAVNEILSLKRNIETATKSEISSVLEKVAKLIKMATDILKRMPEKCSPQDFHEFRYLLGGSQDPKYFPHGGVRIKEMDDVLSFSGASGGQSALIQCLDLFFSITHKDGQKKYTEEMRYYMPRCQRLILDEFDHGVTLKETIMQFEDEKLADLFELALKDMLSFRSAHVQQVYKYVAKYTRPQPETPTLTVQDPNVDGEKREDKEIFGEKGTGGTDYKKFLTEMSEDTNRSRLSIRDFKKELKDDPNAKTESD